MSHEIQRMKACRRHSADRAARCKSRDLLRHDQSANCKTPHTIENPRKITAGKSQRFEQWQHTGLRHGARWHHVLAARYPREIAIRCAAANSPDNAAACHALTAEAGRCSESRASRAG